MRGSTKRKKYDWKKTGKRFKEEDEETQQEKQISKTGKWRDTESRQRS